MRTRHKFWSAVTAALMVGGGVLLPATAASAAPTGEITVADDYFVPGSWGDGIDYTISGFTPDSQVQLLLSRIEQNSSIADFTFVTVDSTGSFTGKWASGAISPELPGESGYPRYTISANSTSGDPIEAPAVPLVIQEAPAGPREAVLEIADTTFPETANWTEPIVFTGSGFTPGATVTVTLNVSSSPSGGDSVPFQVTANEQGEITGELVPGAGFAATPPGDSGYPQYSVGATEYPEGGGDPVAQSEWVNLTIEPAPEPEPEPVTPVIVVTDTVFTAGSWGTGIAYRGTGFSPNAEVFVVLEATRVGSPEYEFITVTADANGNVSGTFLPQEIAAELPDDSGNPQYYFYLGQEEPTFGISNEIRLSVVEDAATAPRVGGPELVQISDLADGVQFPFANFGPEEEVAFVVYRYENGERVNVATGTATSNADGAGVVEFSVDGLTADTALFISLEGLDSGLTAERSFTAVVALPTDPGTGGPAAPAPAAQSPARLVNTGMDLATANTAGLAALVLLLVGGGAFVAARQVRRSEQK
ncbi:hypothetical protein CLV46_3181 [Diaminobutyricimonas aerilata]|uniref:Uncharacterized protein n=1 Tax=Diaminobutyricimonas aerilata TaxID=1162967 RepID=A0A2M9CNY9_9MICO|nr:hypothetical protein [Diaminobutyricimonas aerilata]PJJ73588.1 hypothetical protein CLV46_3181 [Diaminobutyricimonas aerilata]